MKSQASTLSRDYALGSTDAEQERLIWQAARVAPLSERLFREAGIGPGQRVLDIGSGVGDVAMLVAKIVGPSGEVVGIERDPRSIDRARARVAEAGQHNSLIHETFRRSGANPELGPAIQSRIEARFEHSFRLGRGCFEL